MGEDYISRESMTISPFRCAYRQQAERDSPDELGDSDRTGHGGGVWYALSDTLDFRMTRWESRNEMESSKTRCQREESLEMTSPAPNARPPISDRLFFICIYSFNNQCLGTQGGYSYSY